MVEVALFQQGKVRTAFHPPEPVLIAFRVSPCLLLLLPLACAARPPLLLLAAANRYTHMRIRQVSNHVIRAAEMNMDYPKEV